MRTPLSVLLVFFSLFLVSIYFFSPYEKSSVCPDIETNLDKNPDEFSVIFVSFLFHHGAANTPSLSTKDIIRSINENMLIDQRGRRLFRVEDPGKYHFCLAVAKNESDSFVDDLTRDTATHAEKHDLIILEIPNDSSQLLFCFLESRNIVEKVFQVRKDAGCFRLQFSVLEIFDPGKTETVYEHVQYTEGLLNYLGGRSDNPKVEKFKNMDLDSHFTLGIKGPGGKYQLWPGFKKLSFSNRHHEDN